MKDIFEPLSQVRFNLTRAGVRRFNKLLSVPRRALSKEAEQIYQAIGGIRLTFPLSSPLDLEDPCENRRTDHR